MPGWHITPFALPLSSSHLICQDGSSLRTVNSRLPGTPIQYTNRWSDSLTRTICARLNPRGTFLCVPTPSRTVAFGDTRRERRIDPSGLGLLHMSFAGSSECQFLYCHWLCKTGFLPTAIRQLRQRDSSVSTLPDQHCARCSLNDLQNELQSVQGVSDLPLH